MKVVSGAHAPDNGTMELAGRRYAPRGPQEARSAGVAMIYQELNLAHIMLGQDKSRCGVIAAAAEGRIVREALARLGHPDMPLTTPVGRLSVGMQQLVEIARALASRVKVIVFDEPTSSLTRADVDRLFEIIARLRREDLGIIYISHFLEEIRRVCDSFTVLRDGRTVGQGALAAASEASLVTQMVGRDIKELYPQSSRTPGEPVLSLCSLTGGQKIRDVSLELRRGEILGLAGLVGAGRTELVRSIFALDPVQRGTVRVGTLLPAASPKAPGRLPTTSPTVACRPTASGVG
jgi:ribose transport system ATP-binding protein